MIKSFEEFHELNESRANNFVSNSTDLKNLSALLDTLKTKDVWDISDKKLNSLMPNMINVDGFSWKKWNDPYHGLIYTIGGARHNLNSGKNKLSAREMLVKLNNMLD